jgi:hypothetical protein
MKWLMSHVARIRHWGLAGFLALAGFSAWTATPALASAADNVTGWAWSGSIGWIAMNCTALGDCSQDFGVTLRSPGNDPTIADVSGYGWSETAGWVCFGETCPGLTPEGAAGYLQYRADFGGAADELYGWAQVLSLGDAGWISFNCNRDNDAFDACGASSFRTTVDLSTGFFTKGAAADHWAWGATDEGQGVGWVNMSAVATSWVPALIGQIGRPEGVYEPLAADQPGTHRYTFNIDLLGTWGAVGQLAECDLLLPDSSRRTVGMTLGASLRGQLLRVPYTIAPDDPVADNRLWYITGCRMAEVAKPIGCATDAACGAGAVCDEALGRCRDVLFSLDRRLPVFTHGNEWTGLEADEDQYAALRCFAAFPDHYFMNAAQCDFTGDASFALTMRRGMPLEADCDDGLDNDGNGQIDCADRYCQGLSYRCRQLPRTACAWGRADDGLIDCSDGAYEIGGLCCTRQPLAPGANQSQVVNGMECGYREPNDGYFDCDCGSGRYGTADCFAPGAQVGDLCCTAAGDVTRLETAP